MIKQESPRAYNTVHAYNDNTYRQAKCSIFTMLTLQPNEGASVDSV